MRIFITGATGFVGINTVNRLKNKYEISILARDIQRAKECFGDLVDIHKGNVNDYDSIENAMKNSSAVVHIAGLVKSYDYKNLYYVNRDGSKNVALAAKKLGIDNIVHISSLAARGPDNLNRPVSHYGYSKLLGEFEFLKYCYDRDLKILRPPIIYGPYERWFFDVFKMAKKGIQPVLKDIPFSFLYVEDMVLAIEKLIEHNNNNRIKIYTVSDGNRYTWSKMSEYLFDIMGIKGKTININPFIAKIVAYATAFMKDKAPLSIDKTKEMDVDGWSCGYEELHKDTGFVPKYDLKNGLKETFDWYVEHGWL